MTTQTHQPWKPTCWVGGALAVTKNGEIIRWIGDCEVELFELAEESRAKYAATKATAAILRSMRK